MSVLKSALAAATGAFLLVGAAHAAPPSYVVSGKIAGPDGGWDLAGVDPGAHQLYVARGGGAMAVDLATGKVTPDIVKSVRGHAALPVPGTSMVVSTSGGEGKAYVFDGVTGAMNAVLTVGQNPDAAAYDPATKTVWVMNPGSGDISVVDPNAGKVIDTVAVGGSLELGAADGKGKMFVNIEDKNEVVVLDTRTRKLLSRFPLKGCDGPTGIAYDPDTKQIVSACANGVAVISAPDGKEIASLKIGPRPDGAAFDEARHLAFVPSGGDGTLAVIRLGASPEIIQTVKTTKGARTVALDPSTGALYLPSAQYGEPPAGGGRPAMTPGSFAVLVVTPAKS